MTYEERKKWICEQCHQKTDCAYVNRNMEYKCILVEERLEGWELGYQDAISKTYDWLIGRYENQGVVLIDDIYELKQVLEEQQ